MAGVHNEVAKLVEAMMDQMPWCDQPWARCALVVAAAAIRRGRHLTEAEKLINLADAMEDDEGDPDDLRRRNREAANKLREIAARVNQ